MTKSPNFLIASGVSCGSSFLSASIKQHPDIYLPVQQRPEPGFFHFNDRYNKGISDYLSTWFSNVGDQLAIGERSSLYLCSPVAAERIKIHFPDIKLIFCLRNPIDRAWGNYRFTVLEGLEDMSFEEAILTEERRMSQEQGIWAEVQPHSYVQRGMYYELLKKYYDLFPFENILLVKAEDMSKNSEDSFKRIFNFLGVNEDFTPQIVKDFAAPSVIDPKIQAKCRSYFGNRYPKIIESIRKQQQPECELQTAEDQKMLDILKRNLKNGKDVIPESCKKLLASRFKDTIAKLEKIVPFDISDWQASVV